MLAGRSVHIALRTIYDFWRDVVMLSRKRELWRVRFDVSSGVTSMAGAVVPNRLVEDAEQ